jgi:hypothetical protein
MPKKTIKKFLDPKPKRKSSKSVDRAEQVRKQLKQESTDLGVPASTVGKGKDEFLRTGGDQKITTYTDRPGIAKQPHRKAYKKKKQQKEKLEAQNKKLTDDVNTGKITGTDRIRASVKKKENKEKIELLTNSMKDMAKKRYIPTQELKKGGQIKKPKGVGSAQRGWGATGRH